MSKPRVSVVIIDKYERSIIDTLTALRDAVRKPLPTEVVVIDASDGELADIAKMFSEVSWHKFVSKTKRKFTIPEQRNTGVQQAKGDIIVFTDSGCVPKSDWLELLLEPILSGKEQIVAGSTTSRNGTTIHDQNALYQTGRKYLEECPTINLAFTRSAFDAIGGFDERFDYGSDVDFSWRAADKGYKVRYIPEAIVAHDWGKRSENYKRAYRYGVARSRLYKKHPHRWRRLLGPDISVLVYPVFIVGLPLTYWFWPYPLLVVVPVIKNLKQEPIKVIGNHLVYAVGFLRELVRL